MSKIIALLAIILIISGAIVLAVPRQEPAAERSAERSLAPEELSVPGVFVWARDIADQVQAPLSIAFGLISLYWNRKSYMKQQVK